MYISKIDLHHFSKMKIFKKEDVARKCTSSSLSIWLIVELILSIAIGLTDFVGTFDKPTIGY